MADTETTHGGGMQRQQRVARLLTQAIRLHQEIMVGDQIASGNDGMGVGQAKKPYPESR